MENILDDIEALDEKELLRTIWTKPTQTLDFILRRCPRKYVNALIHLSALSLIISSSLGVLITSSQLSAVFVLITTPVVWIIVWLIAYIFAFLLSWTGRSIGGHGDIDQFLTVIAWSYLPTICMLLPTVIEVAVLATGVDYVEIGTKHLATTIFYFTIQIVKVGLSAWSLVIVVSGTMVLQKFKAGKAVLNLILAALVVLIPIFIYEGLKYLM